jgi:predicted nucleotidyltransferase
MTPMQAQGVIREMVDRIIRGFSPEQIILFGSHARGEAGPDSDVDLAVIFPRLEGTRGEKVVKIRIALHGMGIAKDIVVLARRDFEEQRNLVGTIGYVLAHEGKVLYHNA